MEGWVVGSCGLGPPSGGRAESCSGETAAVQAVTWQLGRSASCWGCTRRAPVSELHQTS